jgi:hypothetical protein
MQPTTRNLKALLKNAIDVAKWRANPDELAEIARLEGAIQSVETPPVEFASAATGEGDQQKAIDGLRDIADQPTWDEGVTFANLVAAYDAMRETARKALAALAETSPAAREALQSMENAG